MHNERKPYLEIFSAKKLEEFESRDLMPAFDNFDLEVKKPIYDEVVRSVIEFAPALVSSGNDSQKRILLELIFRLMDDDGNRETLYTILSSIVDDENRDLLKDLEEKLKKYGLRSILGTIGLVEKRLKLVSELRTMVYHDAKHYLECDLQKIIEENFWIFGDEYSMVIGAEEDSFNKLRMNYCTKVLGLAEEDIPEAIASKKEVDLFICGQGSEGRKHRNLIVEIKKPSHKITIDNYGQLCGYRNIVKLMPEFNSEERNTWTFMLIYTDMNDHQRTLLSEKVIDSISGATIDSKPSWRIFMIKWADLLDEVTFRLNYVAHVLNTKKEKMRVEQITARTVIVNPPNAAQK